MTVSPAPGDWAPDECTLPTADRPIRTAEFDRLFASAVTGVRRPAPARLELVLAHDAEPTARDLAARESMCCSFFTFDFADDGSVMGIGVPAAYVGVLDALDARVRAESGGGR